MPPKQSEKTPGEKLLALYTLLMVQGERAISLNEMARILECSKQTVLRLLAQMESSGYGKLDEPIVKGREHFYRLASLPQQELNIGIKELMQLNLCRKMLIQILPKGVSGLLGEESADSTKNSSAKNTGDIAQAYHKGYIDYTAFDAQYTQLLEGIRKQRVCTIKYKKSPSAEARTFDFAPMRMVSYRESISFLGWEVYEDGEVEQKYENSLSLYLQRFLDVKVTRRSSAHLPEVKNAQAENSVSPFGIMRGNPFAVRVLFVPEVASYIHDRVWSNRQEITINDDGSLLLDFDAQSEVEVLSWIMGFGTKAKVLEPEWLQEDIQKQAIALTERYSES